MPEQFKIAAIGALGGATIALVIVFAAASMGAFSDRKVTEQTIHDYLLANPEIIPQAQEALANKQYEDKVAEIQHAVDKQGARAYLNPKIAFVTGPAKPKATVVEFFDYNCPYCRISLPAMKKYYDAHKNDTRFVFIEFPIKGDESVLATRALLAARKQPGKYLPFHFALMAEERLVDAGVIDEVAAKLGLDLAKLHADMQDPHAAQTIAAAELLARRSNIAGTPTFIVNGNVHQGAFDDALLKEFLAKPKRG